MAVVTIRFGGYQGRASVHTRAAEIFGNALRERLGQDVRFELQHNIVEDGRNAADLLTLVESGELTLCYFSTSYLAERAPEFAVLDLPFVVTEREQAYAALDGALGERLADALAAVSRFKLLGYFDNGFRHLSNRLRPIRVPADCQGMRIRTLFSALHGEVFSALGFEPVPLDVKELVDSVRSGAVDAQDNPLTNIYGFGIHEHHPHITLTGHFFGSAGLLCHRESFDGWPPPVREAVRAAVIEATAVQRRMAAEEDQTILARLSAEAIEPVQLSDVERAQFVAAVAPVLDRYRAALGADLFDMLVAD
jgi:TRAP-type C4-dicarboxylate transport system substrate-binding protein